MSSSRLTVALEIPAALRARTWASTSSGLIFATCMSQNLLIKYLRSLALGLNAPGRKVRDTVLKESLSRFAKREPGKSLLSRRQLSLLSSAYQLPFFGLSLAPVTRL